MTKSLNDNFPEHIFIKQCMTIPQSCWEGYYIVYVKPIVQCLEHNKHINYWYLILKLKTTSIILVTFDFPASYKLKTLLWKLRIVACCGNWEKYFIHWHCLELLVDGDDNKLTEVAFLLLILLVPEQTFYCLAPGILMDRSTDFVSDRPNLVLLHS